MLGLSNLLYVLFKVHDQGLKQGRIYTRQMEKITFSQKDLE